MDEMQFFSRDSPGPRALSWNLISRVRAQKNSTRWVKPAETNGETSGETPIFTSYHGENHWKMVSLNVKLQLNSSWKPCETSIFGAINQCWKPPMTGNDVIIIDVYMAMDQYLYIPFLGGWTSINPSYFDVHQGDTVLTHPHIHVFIPPINVKPPYF